MAGVQQRTSWALPVLPLAGKGVQCGHSPEGQRERPRGLQLASRPKVYSPLVWRFLPSFFLPEKTSWGILRKAKHQHTHTNILKKLLHLSPIYMGGKDCWETRERALILILVITFFKNGKKEEGEETFRQKRNIILQMWHAITSLFSLLPDFSPALKCILFLFL